MIGFLVRAAIGGAVAYGVLTVLDKTKVLDRAVELGTGLLDKAAEKLVQFEAASVLANSGRPDHPSDGGGMS